MNLLKETLEELERNKKTIDDVVWIGTRNIEISKENFLVLADTDYDNGYGGQEVAINLIIVGEGWWMERAEYDGSEWWAFKISPERPPKKVSVKALTVHQSEEGSWSSLEDLNNVI